MTLVRIIYTIRYNQIKKDNMYWNENNIKEYFKIKNKAKLDRWYTNQIHPMFVRLIKGMIARFSFDTSKVSKSDMMIETTSHLYITLDKSKKTDKYYYPEKGSSFSYFSAVAFNYLLKKNREGHQYEAIHSSLDESYLVPDDVKSVQVLDMYLKFLEAYKDDLFKKEKNKILLDGFIEIMKNEQDSLSSSHCTKDLLELRGYEIGSYNYVRNKLGNIYMNAKIYIIENPECNELPKEIIE